MVYLTRQPPVAQRKELHGAPPATCYASAMRRFLYVLILIAAACNSQPNRWEAAEKKAEADQKTAQEAPAKVKGAKLNAYFPSEGPGGAKRVFTAEKDGYVEAKLVADDGSDLALLAVSEAAPEARTKFAGATDKVEGFPLVTVGSNQSSLLVGDKFQVKVSSKVLGAPERKALLTQFDLRGLASL